MIAALTVALSASWILIGIGCWLGWQLLRQNGRILLRLDELEKRLNELEFGGADEPEGLPLGSEAPAFELPDLADERKSLAQFHGQPVLLIFFNPDCGFCREMVSKLKEKVESGKQKAEMEIGGRSDRPLVLILSTGDAETNRQFFAEHELGCPVLLQKDGEVAKAYQAHGTPSGYLINAEGRIASSLALGAEALLKLAEGKAEIGKPNSEEDQSRVTSSATSYNGHSRENRFGNHSLTNSKIKRDGLKAGTPAPDFRLPRLDGKGGLTLSELRGKRVLLVFSSPGCGPCNTLAPELEKFHRQQLERDLSPVAADRHAGDPGVIAWQSELGAAAIADRPRTAPITVVMISKGEPKENRAKVKEHGLTFPVLLQQQWEISRRYAMFATPIAYWIDKDGIITHDVAVGVEPILALMDQSSTKPEMQVENPVLTR